MTFEEFVGGRREVDDVSVADRWTGEEQTVPDAGLVYPTGLFISRVGPYWPEGTRQEGCFHLHMSNEEMVDDDLAFLERELWKAFREELVDEPAP
jgi:hypothetical protein